MTNENDDARVALACGMSMAQVVERLALPGLTKHSGELIGPCPVCGGDDRFAINPQKGVFLCRTCQAKGDGVQLVRHVMSCSFMEAVAFLVGGADVQISPQELARRQAAQKAAKRKEEEEAQYFKDQARRHAQRIWQDAQPHDGTLLHDYLALRGLDLAAQGHGLKCLRFAPDHPYVRKIDGENLLLHRGPAMIAAIQGADGTLQAVHQTWIDLRAPKGKAIIEAKGFEKPLPSKTVRGSKKGGAIRLSGNHCGPVLVMGEGIETTGTAMASDAVPGASYWAGVDLGNMAGSQAPQAGPGLSGVPDLSDTTAFVPPRTIGRFIYIQDGDSAPDLTRAKLLAGLRRAAHFIDGLQCEIVHAGDGVDLNDLIKGAAL